MFSPGFIPNGKARSSSIFLELHDASSFFGAPSSLKSSQRGTDDTDHFSAVSLVLYGLLMVGLLIISYAISLYTPYALVTPTLVYELNNDIAAYKMGSFAMLNASTFSLALPTSAASYGMNFSSDPYYSDITSVPFTAAYTANVVNTRVPLSALVSSSDSLSDDMQEENANVSISAVVHKNTSQVTVNFPVWYSLSTPFNQTFTTPQCQFLNGYTDAANNCCVTYFVVDSICATVAMNGSLQWKAGSVNGGQGCYYPFNNVGTYISVPYAGNNTKLDYFASIALKQIPIFVRSVDDPYVELESLSEGFATLNAVLPATALYLLVAGALIMAVAIAGGAFYASHNAASYNKLFSHPPVFRYLGAFVFCLLAVAGVGLPLLDHWALQMYWTWSPFLGLWLTLVFAPAAIWSLVIFWGSINKAKLTDGFRFGLSISVSIIILVLCTVSIVVMVMPGDFNDGVLPGQVDLIYLFVGSCFCIVMVPFSVLNIAACVRSMWNIKAGDEYSPYKISNKSIRRNTNGVVLILVGLPVFVVCILCALYFPSNYKKQVVFKPLSGFTSNYLDIVVFYGYLLVLCLLFMLCAIFKPLYRLLQTRMQIRFYTYIEIETTAGELIFLSSYAGLFAFWVWYFVYYIANPATPQILNIAYNFGNVTNLFIASLLLPVTRNSMWTQLIGVPFERSVKYHRWMGILTLLAMSGHMFTFWSYWQIDYRALAHNIVSLQNIPYTSYWQPIMMQLVWLGAVIFMGIFSYSWFRRHKFELFYYSHHFYIIFLLAAVLHSFRGWYYFLGGLTMWLVDRFLRFWRGSKAFKVTCILAHNNAQIIEIKLKQNGFRYRAGQYAFINIPAISPLEWHPFSISSSPDEDVITFHIKDMGRGTWTNTLGAMCASAGGLLHSADVPAVNIDGPYGYPPKFESESVVLVAGGIGITPMISMFKDLYYLHSRQSRSADPVKHVVLMWVVREHAATKMFAEVFNKIMNDQTTDTKFEIALFVTGKKEEEKLDPDTQQVLLAGHHYGRPNLDSEFQYIINKYGMPVVAACGPPPLVKQARDASYDAHIPEFHEETFEL